MTVLKDGTIRARLPSPSRKAREFSPGEMPEAVAWLDAMLAPQPAAPAAAPLTLETWTGVWYETYVAAIYPPNTARWYLYALRRLEPRYQTTLPDLRQSMLQAIVGTLLQRLDPRSVKSIVGVWRRCLEAAVDDEHLARNPAKKLVVPKAPPREHLRHVTAAEVAALWPAIRDHRFEAAYALLLGCGLRLGEVLGLSWANVDLANRRAWIGPQWTNGHWRPHPKGRNPHWVRLPERVVAALIRHRNRQPEGSVLVCQTTYGQGARAKKRRQTEPRPWSAEAIREALIALCDEHQIDVFTPHATRRGLVTALLDGGASLSVVAERVGHASTATTLGYAGRTDEARRQADELQDRYLGIPTGGDFGADTG